VWNYGGGEGDESSLADFGEDMFNELGTRGVSYKVYACWLSE
jgi:hypothetical protein